MRSSSERQASIIVLTVAHKCYETGDQMTSLHCYYTILIINSNQPCVAFSFAYSETDILFDVLNGPALISLPPIQIRNFYKSFIKLDRPLGAKYAL